MKEVVGGLLGPVTVRALRGWCSSDPCTIALKLDAIGGAELRKGGSDGPRERPFALGNFQGLPTKNFIWFLPIHSLRDDLCVDGIDGVLVGVRGKGPVDEILPEGSIAAKERLQSIFLEVGASTSSNDVV